MSRRTSNPEHALFAGGGEMSKLIRAMDWGQTPLGPMDCEALLTHPIRTQSSDCGLM
jgi:hypothetical protein